MVNITDKQLWQDRARQCGTWSTARHLHNNNVPLWLAVFLLAHK